MDDPLAQTAGRRFAISTLILGCAALLLSCAAIYLFWLASLSFESFRALVLSVIPPGYDDRFTPALYTKISLSLRAISIAIAGAAVALVVFGKRWWLILVDQSREVASLVRDVRRSIGAMKDDPWTLLLLCLILLWAIFLRLQFYGEPVRKDEAYSFVYYARRPLFLALSYYTANNHLLSTFLMHVSTSLFGNTLWAMRLPALISGILLVPATFAMASLYFGRNAGLLASALVAASSPLIEFSFNARGYGLGSLLLITMLSLAVLALRGASGAWLLLPFPAALALYTVPTMSFGIGGAFLYLLASRSNLRRTIEAGIITGLLTVVLYSPVLATVGLTAITSNQWTAPVTRERWPALFTRELASLWAQWNMDVPLAVSVLICAGAILAMTNLQRLRSGPVATLLWVATAGGAALFVKSMVPYRRTWLFLLPLFLTVVASGWDLVIRRFKYSKIVAAFMSVVISGWMGWTVLTMKSLRHSQPESVGGRSAEAIVLGMREHLARGAQFICRDFMDSSLDFNLITHGIPYAPSRSGDLLIVTLRGNPARQTTDAAKIAPEDLLDLHKIAEYEDADVYLARRGPGLPFVPVGNIEIGAFTAAGTATR